MENSGGKSGAGSSLAEATPIPIGLGRSVHRRVERFADATTDAVLRWLDAAVVAELGTLHAAIRSGSLFEPAIEVGQFRAGQLRVEHQVDQGPGKDGRQVVRGDDLPGGRVEIRRHGGRQVGNDVVPLLGHLGFAQVDLVGIHIQEVLLGEKIQGI